MPDVYTTGEAARACRMSRQTIIRCCDRGVLKAWKVPGKGGVRRIGRAELVRFAAAHGLPAEWLSPPPSAA